MVASHYYTASFGVMQSGGGGGGGGGPFGAPEPSSIALLGGSALMLLSRLRRSTLVRGRARHARG